MNNLWDWAIYLESHWLVFQFFNKACKSVRDLNSSNSITSLYIGALSVLYAILTLLSPYFETYTFELFLLHLFVASEYNLNG